MSRGEGGSLERTAVLLDVDGVLCPMGMPSVEWAEWLHDPDDEMLAVSAQMARAIGDLGAEVHWLTSWEGRANEVISPLVDWPQWPVLVHHGRTSIWWKLLAALQLLETGRFARVAWLDDDHDRYADEVDDYAQSYRDAGVLLTICPESAVGLTRSDLQIVQAHLAA